MKKKKHGKQEPLGYTQLLKLQRREREFWKSFGIDDPEQVPPQYHRVDLRCTRISDEELGLMATRIKRIEMLDLNDTEITATGIENLVVLEHLAELRIKDCAQIDDSAIPHLSQLKGLRLLNIKGTRITINGLLGIMDAKALEELYFTSSGREDISEQLQQLQQILPTCRLVVDGKEYVAEQGDI